MLTDAQLACIQTHGQRSECWEKAHRCDAFEKVHALDESGCLHVWQDVSPSYGNIHNPIQQIQNPLLAVMIEEYLHGMREDTGVHQ
jgi:hypothetical protein